MTVDDEAGLFAELPASVLRLVQRVMATMVESHEAFLLRADEAIE